MSRAAAYSTCGARVLSANSPTGCSADKQPVTWDGLCARRGAPFAATRPPRVFFKKRSRRLSASSGVQGFQRAVGFEALREEVTVQPLKLAIVGNRPAAFETAVERRFNQRVIVEIGEDAVGDRTCRCARDACAFDLAKDS